MTLLRHLYREKVAITGAVVTIVGALTGLDLISDKVGGAIITVLGALFVLLRAVLVPAEEVVVQRKPGAPTAVAGPASPIADGTPVTVRKLHAPD